MAAVKGDRTVNDWPASFGVHPTLILGWKTGSPAPRRSSPAASGSAADAEARQAELYEQIGRLKMDLEWLKKKAAPLG